MDEKDIKNSRSILNDLKVVKTISESRLSVVYKVKNDDNKVYALKKISKDKQDCEENARKEIYFYEKIPYHPYILKYHGYAETDDEIYILLEYIKNKDLWFSFFADNTDCSEKRLAKFTWQMCEALRFIHKKKVVHADLKIENILLDENDNIRLCDFGLSYIKSYDEEDRKMCGTLGCMAPELLIRNSKYIAKPIPSIDVWALGVLIFEMYFRKSPFISPSEEKVFLTEKGVDKRKLLDRLKEKPSFPKKVSRELQNLFLKMFRTNPKFRISISEIQRSRWIKKIYSDPDIDEN